MCLPIQSQGNDFQLQHVVCVGSNFFDEVTTLYKEGEFIYLMKLGFIL
jgi:hypothetical protein